MRSYPNDGSARARRLENTIWPRFFPFSYGPRTCAAKNMALIEMRMVICWILRRFLFSRAPGVVYEDWEVKIQDWLVVHQEPLLISVSLRE